MPSRAGEARADGRPRRRVIGVDFSGARDAGRRIWIAAGSSLPGGSLRIDSCVRAADLPGGGPGREAALAALRARIASEGPCVVGLDFPFSLPRALVPDPSWEDFIRAFPRRYRDAEAFRAACLAAAGGRELRRATDRAARVPFSAYNLRLYRQTFHGIRDVLVPLVTAGAARASPLQPADPAKPLLLEICPASTLKAARRYLPYKGRDARRRAARRAILARAEADLGAPLEPALRRPIVADAGGDALDAVLAALAAGRAPAGARGDALARIEGHVHC